MDAEYPVTYRMRCVFLMWINTLINYFALKEFQEINKRERNVIIWYLSAFSIAEASIAMSLCWVPHVLLWNHSYFAKKLLRMNSHQSTVYRRIWWAIQQAKWFIANEHCIEIPIIFNLRSFFASPISLKMGILTHLQYSCITFHCWNLFVNELKVSCPAFQH